MLLLIPAALAMILLVTLSGMVEVDRVRGIEAQTSVSSGVLQHHVEAALFRSAGGGSDDLGVSTAFALPSDLRIHVHDESGRRLVILWPEAADGSDETGSAGNTAASTRNAELLPVMVRAAGEMQSGLRSGASFRVSARAGRLVRQVTDPAPDFGGQLAVSSRSRPEVALSPGLPVQIPLGSPVFITVLESS